MGSPQQRNPAACESRMRCKIFAGEKKMSTTNFCLFLTLALATCLPLEPARAQRAKSTTIESHMQHMKTAVVQIRYTSNAPTPRPGPPVPQLPPESTLAGTGFFVGHQGYVLTAGHV